MKAARHSDLWGLWSVLWRSFVYLPWMLLVFASVGSVWVARWFLPVGAVMLLGMGAWQHAGATLALWCLATAIYRRFQLARYFESPPSLL